MDRVISGIQSSGRQTLGNYIGALKQFTKFQDEYELFIFVANMHAITVPKDKKQLQQNTIDLVAFYLACGLDINKTNIFLQSDVFFYIQLGWILQCQTYMGELNRMTQFKDKSTKHNNIGVGLYTYPALQAADILLYDAKYVPVGQDQKQHIELARDLAIRFNNKYGETFVVPEAIIQEEGARIMSLVDPTKKMSKSDENDKATIYLLDDEKTIIKKIKSATTDSFGQIKYDTKNQPGIANLLTIFAALQDLSIKEAEAKFKDYNYADFKDAIAKSVCDILIPLQERYKEAIESGKVVDALTRGKEKANQIAYKKVMKVQDKLGLNLKRSK
jgi:tryptophanyl-tRNA synthetase